MSKFQIIYQSADEEKSDVHWLWAKEAKLMKKYGVIVGTYPFKEMDSLLYRGSSSLATKYYELDGRFINQKIHVENYLKMSIYYDLIQDLTVETFFVDDLNKNTEFEILNRGWEKAFIKSDIRSLEHIEEGMSIWPNNSLDVMKKYYSEVDYQGLFAVRNLMNQSELLLEDRYWVLNGNVYHRSLKIPEIVKEAASRLNIWGSKYYTIDATPNFIIEVNPGESSDRYLVNPVKLFASWIKKEFT